MSVTSGPLVGEGQDIATAIPKQEENIDVQSEVNPVLQVINDTQKKSRCKLSSPSPRGVETWGPCSPFVLPNPSPHINFIQPEEITAVLNRPLSERSSKSQVDKGGRISRLPKNDFMEMEDLFREAEVPYQTPLSPGNEAATHMDAKMTDLPFLDGNEDGNFIDDLFLQLKPSFHGDSALCPVQTEMKNTVKCNESPHSLTQWNATVLKSDLEVRDKDSYGRKVPNTEAQNFRNKNRMSDHFRFTAGEKAALKGRNDIFIASENETETSFVKSEKDSATTNPTNDRSGVQAVGCNDHLSEAELKRIRRVKNRASVEKCRTKQRLRMEALQTELENLTSENKTLRELASWMDSSVVVISTQLSEPEALRENSNSISSIRSLPTLKVTSEKSNEP